MTAKTIKVSIIVLCYNNLTSCTEPCVASILKNTKIGSYELILVDNFSSDGTDEYINKIKSQHAHVISKINSENRGYAAGNNDGANLSSGDYLVFLNNDTLVSENWLESLLSPFDRYYDLGLVGPITNSAGNEQQVHLNNLNSKNFQHISSEYVRRQSGVLWSTERLGFFCVAIKKELFKMLGGFDENFGIGMFEDDDLCLRVLNAGMKIMVAEDCFVFHKGSASFKKLKNADYINTFNKNLKYYEEKNRVRWSYANISISYFKHLANEIKELSDGLHSSNSIERIMVRLDGFENSLLRSQFIEEAFNRKDGNTSLPVNSSSWRYRWNYLRMGISNGSIDERFKFAVKTFKKLMDKI